MYGAGALLMLIGGVFLARWHQLQFTNVFVLGAREVPAEQIQERVSAYFDTSAALVLPKSSMLVLNAHALASELQRTFPQIASVNVNRIFTDRAVEVTVVERDPWAMYCKGDTCAYISEDGVAYAYTLARDAALMTLVRSGSGGELALGTVWCNEACLSTVSTLKQTLERDAQLGSLVIAYGDGDALTLTTGEGWDIRMLSTADIPRVAENIKIALDTTIKDRRKSLAYIDARFGDRVHYQYK